MAELPLRKRIYYGMGGLTMNLPDLLVMQWLLIRYAPPEADKHLLPPALAGVLILCGRIIEGSTNPFIAHWSDGCTSRWGRRLPFIRLGVLPLALAFFFLFTPPVNHLHWANIAHVIVVVPIYFLLYGAVVTPYLALLPEITSDLKERVDLTTFQSVFLMLTTVLAFTVMPSVIQRYGWRVFAGVAAILVVLFMLPVATRIHEKRHVPNPAHEKLNVLGSTWLVLRNRPFRYFVAATAFYWYGMNGMIALVTYWVPVVLYRAEGDVAKLMGPFLVTNILFFFVFNALARKFGKYVMLQVTFLTSAVAMASLCLVGHLPFGSNFVQTAIVISMFGAPVAGFMVLPFAMLADIVDYDEQLTGRRREGIFFGVQGVIQKALIGLSVTSLAIVPYLRSDGAQVLCEGKPLSISGAYRAEAGAPGPEAPQEAPRSALLPGTIRVVVSPRGLDAPWTLDGPGGFIHRGVGAMDLPNLGPGPYRITWGDVPGWVRPSTPRALTPFGLKLMALFCGISSVIAFLIFLGYPLRERDGKVVLVN